MTFFFWASYTLGLVFIFVFVLQGGKYIRRSLKAASQAGPVYDAGPAWPKAAIIVPLTGAAPEMRTCLTSLLRLDYPEYETIFVTADLEDPATALVRELLAHYPKARHVLSGPASTCSQKNHNLLAGLQTLDRATEILVFCDSNHLAPPYFLKELVRPLAGGQALMTTGFHRIAPGDFRPATLGMLVTVLIIHLCHGHPGLVQPWGGATAIWRQTFEKFQVASLWSVTVVDDVALALRLQKEGIRVKPVPAACLDTPLAGQTLAGWIAWLTRQLLYVKYFMPLTWLAAALLAYFLMVPPALALGAVLGGALGLISWGFVMAGGVYLLLLLGTALGLRSLAPRPIPWGNWLAAVGLTWLVFCWSYLKTWWIRRLAWHGIAYEVTWGGIVRKVIRSS